MALFFHELKRDRLKLIIWTGAIAFMLAVSLLVYPIIEPMMAEMNKSLEQMGMGQSTFTGFGDYFAEESSSVLGLGGAFFAALLGIAALAKEEHDRTAEFLLTHPVSRSYVVGQKLAAALAEILILNLAVSLLSIVSTLVIGQSIDWALLASVFLRCLFMQIEIACLMFGLSAFLRGNGVGIGIGVAFALYFLSLLANVAREMDFLRYITPFSFVDVTTIASGNMIELKYLIPAVALTVLGVVLAFVKYRKKDIQA